MGAPPRHRNKPTNSNGDVTRRRLIKWMEDGHWFSIKEACFSLQAHPALIRRYVAEFRRNGYLAQRTRVQDKPSRAPEEYSYTDRWEQVLSSDNPVIQKHVKRLQDLATIYKSGMFPISDSIDEALTDVTNDIIEIGHLLDLLSVIAEQPDLRRIKTFVKKMGTTHDS